MNLAVMGWSSNLSIYGSDTLFSLAKGLSGARWWVRGHRLVVLGAILLAVCLFIVWFLGTRLGLSVRATGDNVEMVRACAVNPGRTTTVGLCLAGSLTGLGGCLVGLLNTSSDINLGSGMVTVALASLIIGATVAGSGSMARRVAGVVLGACLYRIIIALAIQTRLVPTEAFKLVSAVIVAVASASPQGKRFIALQRQKLAARRKEEAPC